MFIIQKQDNNRFTIVCEFTEVRTLKRQFLYSMKNLTIDDAARFMLGRGNEDLDGEIETLFKYTNVNKAYVNDDGKLSAVNPQ